MTTIKKKTSLNDKPSHLIITSMNTFILHYNEAAWCLHGILLFFLFQLEYLSQYMSGFGNDLSSEDPRCPGSLPEGQVTHTSAKTHYVAVIRGD